MTDFDVLIKRREFLQGTFTLAAGAFVASALPITKVLADSEIRFSPVTANGDDSITLPEGFDWQTVASWGDPLWSNAPEFDQKSRGTADSQAKSFGDNCDGMAFFQVEDRNLLVVNNEYCNRNIIYGNRARGCRKMTMMCTKA